MTPILFLPGTRVFWTQDSQMQYGHILAIQAHLASCSIFAIIQREEDNKFINVMMNELSIV